MHISKSLQISLIALMLGLFASGAFAATSIATGYYHSCALTSAGAVKCWGWNNAGQLGDNSTTNSYVPVDVVGLSSGVIAIATGNAHNCALTSAGAVKCWGSNWYGQLGDNSTTTRLTPVAVVGLSSGVTAIAAGGYHTCAITSAGAVKCWGYNGSGYLNGPGQLGDNSTLDRHTPVAVVGLSSGVTAVAGGGEHTCALTAAGAMKCWGRNDYGQLGDNSTINRRTPVDVVGLSSSVIAMAGGQYHTCAVTAVGAVKCWGFGGAGALGDNSAVQRNTPVDVVGLSSGAVAIAAGESHSCALTNTGVVKCWGANWYNQLGDNSNTGSLTPVDVVGLSSGVTAIASRVNHTCAVVYGVVKCWGDNAEGQLGDNSTMQRTAPVTVSGLDGDSDQDGMPDLWETLYGLNPLVNDANGDLDGDGFSNKKEYDNGTNPTVADVKIKNDFGGDRKADILLRNTTTGDWSLASLYGLTVLNQSTVGAFSDVENKIVSTGDFDGDGDADILTRGTMDGLLPGTFHIDLTSGATVTSSAWLFTMSTDLNDEVMSTKDFNKDGKADVLLRNSASGVWTLNLMDGVNDPITGTLNASADTCYTMKGDGDYDGNGYPDILLRKDACGGVQYPWLVNTTDGDSTILASGTATGVSMSTAWGTLVADKDFNGDGRDDLLIRALSGSVQQWLLYDMNGVGAPSASGLLNIAVQSMWQYAADTDFNGDGKVDLVLRSTDTGQWYGYLLDGRTLLGNGVIAMAMNPIWGLQAIDDNNGDGKGDVLLRNSASGAWWLYLMNGLTVQANSYLTITTDLNYVLQND